MLIYGAHMSIAKGLVVAVVKANEEYGVKAMQIFTKNPRGRTAKPLDQAEADNFKDYVKKQQIFVVAHCSYLLNFAKPLAANHWSLQNLIDDLARIDSLGGVGVVLHIGKFLDQEYEVAQKYLVKNLKFVLAKTKRLNNFLIFENTAGQGTEMGKNWTELAALYNALDHDPRVKFCLDTQHSFAAGYDWRDDRQRKIAFKEFDQLIGLRNLVCFHFNDSLKDLDCRVDRHQNLGKGYIGLKSLKAIAELAVKKSIPLIIETPEKNWSHSDDLRIIRQWFS